MNGSTTTSTATADARRVTKQRFKKALSSAEQIAFAIREQIEVLDEIEVAWSDAEDARWTLNLLKKVEKTLCID